MKHLFLIITTLITLNSCSNDDDGGTLPPITQTGANTVGCLVNGKVFLPSAKGLSAPVNCFYQLVEDEFYFTMAFSDLKNGIESVNLFTAKIELKQGETYSLNRGFNPDQGGGAEYYVKLTDKYNTNLTQMGELTITRLDLQNSVISGTFWFDAINSDGEIVEIREGRFDWNY